jgi:predicted signal transduction protein with EAL and GGDEF domain
LPQRGTAERIAARLLERLSPPYRVGVMNWPALSASACCCWRPEQQADDVLRDAAIAMRVAKAEGGNQFAVFAREMHEQAVLRAGLQADLRNAIERGELFTVYQPVVGLLPDGRIDRAPASKRWCAGAIRCAARLGRWSSSASPRIAA